MLLALKNLLCLCGIFRYENTRYLSPFIVQLLTSFGVISSIGSLYIGSIIYSIKYHNVSEFIKSAGYSHNNILTVLITYIYLLITRSTLRRLIEAWEQTIDNSLVFH